MAESFETFARQANVVNYASAACITILAYNHTLTFDEETSRIWPSRSSLAKALFLVNRYLVEAIIVFNCIAASQPYRSPGFCIFYLRWLTVASTVSNAVVQGILVLRIWALYRNNKTVLGIAYFFYFGGTITLIGLVIKDYVGEDVLINGDLAALPGCYASGVPSIIAGFWIGPLIIETVLFIIVVSRAFLWWKEGTTVPRILSILTKDSTMYFAIVFALLLANYLVFEFGPPFFSSLLVTPSITAGCILGSHIFLNLRAMSLDVEFEDIDFNNTSYEYSTSGPNQSHRRSHFIVVPMPLTHMRRPRYGWGTNMAEGDKEREGDDGVIVSVKTEVEVNADDAC